jgi:hypothetical protein
MGRTTQTRTRLDEAHAGGVARLQRHAVWQQKCKANQPDVKGTRSDEDHQTDPSQILQIKMKQRVRASKNRAQLIT